MKAYIKHPVSQELKKKINQKGYTVIDARFAPDGYQLPDELKVLLADDEKADTVKRKGRPPKDKEPEIVEKIIKAE